MMVKCNRYCRRQIGALFGLVVRLFGLGLVTARMARIQSDRLPTTSTSNSEMWWVSVEFEFCGEISAR